MVNLEAYGSWEEALGRLGESQKALLALLSAFAVGNPRGAWRKGTPNPFSGAASAGYSKEAPPSWLTRPLREGAWTPLMVAEHIALVEDSTARVLRRLRRVRLGEALPPLPLVRGEFRDGKPQAPEGVRPKGGLGLEEVLDLLERARAFLLEEAAQADPHHPATFPHPFFGELTALGWVRAAAYHEAHHLAQLQEALVP